MKENIMSTILNPGTGALMNAPEKEAFKNIKVFIEDIGVYGIEYNRNCAQDYGNGRYAFTIKKDGYSHEIQMPGVPIEGVRYTKSDDQNIWDFPRLYVDGSSWVWCYALAMCFAKEEK